MNGSRLRIEVSDPDTRVLPVLCSAGDGAVQGRGLALIDAVAERWGVLLRDDSKITWCELATGLRSSIDHADGPQVAKAEALLGLLGMAVRPDGLSYGRLGVAAAQESAIGLIADLLHWLRAHGCDPDSALDRAQTHFEAELGEAV